MVLPGGSQYKVIILPTAHQMNPDNLPLSSESKSKIDSLKNACVIIPELPYLADDFSVYGIERDIIIPENIAWTHRLGDEADLYFIADQSG